MLFNSKSLRWRHERKDGKMGGGGGGLCCVQACAASVRLSTREGEGGLGTGTLKVDRFSEADNHEHEFNRGNSNTVNALYP
jgi:hypothetical protein